MNRPGEMDNLRLREVLEGVEVKESYFRTATANLRQAEGQLSLTTVEIA